MPESKGVNNNRKRFVLRLFAVGTLVPIVLVIVGSIVGPRLQWEPQGFPGSGLWILTWLVWPTWVFLLDAEHVGQIVFVLLVAAPLNGLWYGVVGFLIWHLRHRGKAEPDEPPPATSL